MSKTCAKCQKTVYPTEELKCLDKMWHKACFRCEVCGMTLNMKNYKGYEKLPYCSAHYPTTKFTAVSDTPEMNRLSQNTKMQSQLAYHADFEKEKSKFTQVADDPEMLRLLENSAKFSTVKYHEDFEKNIKGTKIQVDTDPETQRVMEHSKLVSQAEYKGIKQQQEMEMRRANIPAADYPEPAQVSRRASGSMSDQHQPSPYSGKFQPGKSTMYTGGGETVEQASGNRRIGSITDYDPMRDNWGSGAAGQQTYTTGHTQHGQEWEEQLKLPRQNSQEQQAPPGPRRPPIGGVPMVPLNQPVNLQVHHSQQDKKAQPQYYPAPQLSQPAPQAYKPPPQPAYQPPPQQAYQPPPPPVQPAAAPASKGPRYTCMYDYEAADDDEVAFREGDLVVDVEPIDEGWMIGTIQRTGQRGMLPANYVGKA